MALTVDPRAVGRGVAAYLAIAAPCGLLVALVHGSATPGHESNLWVAAALIIIVVAPLVAGAVAGAAQPAPLVHGALAVAGPAGIFLLINSIVATLQGTMSTQKVANFLLFLAIFTALGMLGGYIGFRRRQRLA